MEPQPNPTSSLAIPIAIIVGFAFIALAVFFTRGNDSQAPVVAEPTTGAEVVQTDGPRPLDETDYILGNPNAQIVLIEYSDYDCQFCKEFHITMNRIIDEFGIDGRVAWVYRQFPIEQLHPNSPRISEAALCVGDIGGNTAFWQFSDLIFEQREFSEPTNVIRLPEYAERVGVDRNSFNSCMESGRMHQAVLDSIKDGFDAGIRGTPYTYVIAGNQQAVIDGARSYEYVRGVVSSLLDQIDGTFDADAVAAEAAQIPEAAPTAE